jgi:hypothetical protein
MKRVIMVALMGLVMTGPAWGAERMTVNRFLDLYDSLEGREKEVITSRIGGWGTGFQMANFWLRGMNRKRLFCTDDNVVLGPNNYVLVLKFYVNTSGKGTFPVSGTPMLLLEGLRKAFPCKE